MKLHVDMDLFTETANAITLTEDTASQRQFLPQPAALTGALLLGDRTEQLTATMMSTQRAAKCIDRVLRDILDNMMHRPHRLKASIIRAVQYLSHNARRARPKRDMKTERLKLGLKHLFVSD